MSEDIERDGIVEGHLRENLKRRRRDGEPAPHPLVVDIDDEIAREAVSTVIQAYDTDDSLPGFETTPLASAISGYSTAESIHDGIQKGNIGKVGYHKGIDTSDDTYFNVTEYIRDQWKSLIDGQGVMKVLVNGDEGSGKTDYSLEEGFVIAPRVIKQETDKRVIGISNVDVDVKTTNLDAFYHVSSTSSLDELTEENYREDTELIVVLDEGDQLFGGFGKSQVAGRALGDRIKLFRKFNAHILMTSQRQVAPDIRNRFKIRHKPNDEQPNKMLFANNVDKEGNPVDVEFKTTNVPPTSVDYNTLARGQWEHDVDDEDDEGDDDRGSKKIEREKRKMSERINNLHENTDMSFQDIADAIGLSKGQVSKIANRYD
ncbi:hypothetical protein BDK61_2866 [Haloarcula quadrata]|uniref:Uncharacterized protein n=1 Tax=Haloarcula quadrata TaxID=182779 RepID=A0A495R854_9EURY|nr:hypothetical protein [Haloarcula quadrata]RKS83481.1 hypothetical protein BDK61_2866 [Haloarcula quadrata]